MILVLLYIVKLRCWKQFSWCFVLLVFKKFGGTRNKFNLFNAYWCLVKNLSGLFLFMILERRSISCIFLKRVSYEHILLLELFRHHLIMSYFSLIQNMNYCLTTSYDIHAPDWIFSAHFLTLKSHWRQENKITSWK